MVKIAALTLILFIACESPLLSQLNRSRGSAVVDLTKNIDGTGKVGFEESPTVFQSSYPQETIKVIQRLKKDYLPHLFDAIRKTSDRAVQRIGKSDPGSDIVGLTGSWGRPNNLILGLIISSPSGVPTLRVVQDQTQIDLPQPEPSAEFVVSRVDFGEMFGAQHPISPFVYILGTQGPSEKLPVVPAISLKKGSVTIITSAPSMPTVATILPEGIATGIEIAFKFLDDLWKILKDRATDPLPDRTPPKIILNIDHQRRWGPMIRGEAYDLSVGLKVIDEDQSDFLHTISGLDAVLSSGNLVRLRDLGNPNIGGAKEWDKSITEIVPAGKYYGTITAMDMEKNESKVDFRCIFGIAARTKRRTSKNSADQEDCTQTYQSPVTPPKGR